MTKTTTRVRVISVLILFLAAMAVAQAQPPQSRERPAGASHGENSSAAELRALRQLLGQVSADAAQVYAAVELSRAQNDRILMLAKQEMELRLALVKAGSEQNAAESNLRVLQARLSQTPAPGPTVPESPFVRQLTEAITAASVDVEKLGASMREYRVWQSELATLRKSEEQKLAAISANLQQALASLKAIAAETAK